MSELPPVMDSALQRRVLRGLYLKLMFRATRAGRRQKKIVGPVGGMAMSCVFFILFGLFAFMFNELPLTAFASCLHGMTFVMVGMNLALISGGLLFNKDEAEVMLHRPVDPKAMLVAKVQVIVLVSLVLGVCLNVCGLVAGALHSQGTLLFLPAHLISLAFETVFAASFVVLAYNLCLRWFGRDKLENLMTAVQVLVAVVAVAGGQIVPRLMREIDVAHLKTLPLWSFALPPVWFGAMDAALIGRFESTAWLVVAVFAPLVTVFFAWLGVYQLAATYETGLVTLNETSSSGPSRAGGRRDFGQWLLRLPVISTWVRDPVERVAFRLTLANLARSRGTKLRVYPMLGQFLVYPFIVFLMGNRGDTFVEPLTISFCGAFIAMLPISVIDRLRISEDWKAADLFWYTPVVRPAAFFDGVRKAVVLMLAIPAVAFVAVVAAAHFRERSYLLVLLLPGLLTLPVLSRVPAILRPYVPFSLQPDMEGQNANGCLMAAIFMIGSITVGSLTVAAWVYGYFVPFLLGEAVAAGCLAYLLAGVINRKVLRAEE